MGRKANPGPLREDDPLSKLLDRLLTMEQITDLVQASPSTIRRMVERGQFPKPVVIGAMIRWRARDYKEWMEGQAKDA